MQVPALRSGNVTPTSTINTPVNYLVFGIAVDTKGNIYASAVNVNTYVPEIFVYAAGSSGLATPIRTIAGSATKLYDPRGMAVDASSQIFIIDEYGGNAGPAILVYAAGATGNVAPSRIMQGTNTTLTGPISLALDAAGNVYTIDGTNNLTPNYVVDVFAVGASGNIAPSRIIRSSSTVNALIYYGISIGDDGAVYVSSEDAAYNGAVTVFPASASGTVAPSSIVGGSAIGSNSVAGLQVDAAGNIYAAASDSAGYQVLSFTPNLSGDVVPTTRAAVSGYTRSEFGTLAIR